jgi:hypothetical protein
VIVTRGSTLQEAMRALVRRFTEERNIRSFDDLIALGLNPPTNRQRAAVIRRVQRPKDPLDFQEAWTNNFVSDKFGAATTHWRKLMDRIHRGVGNPCPLLLVGLPASLVSFDPDAVIDNDLEEAGNEANEDG